MFSLLLLCILDIDEVGDIGKGEDEWWAGFRAVVRKEEPNPACNLELLSSRIENLCCSWLNSQEFKVGKTLKILCR